MNSYFYARHSAPSTEPSVSRDFNRPSHALPCLSVMVFPLHPVMDPVMACCTDRFQIGEVVCPAFAQRDPVMDLLGKGRPAFSHTLLAHRMSVYICVPYAFPVPSVSFMGIIVPPVLFISAVHQPAVLLAVAGTSHCRTAASGIGTARSWHLWHVHHSFPANKKPSKT